MLERCGPGLPTLNIADAPGLVLLTPARLLEQDTSFVACVLDALGDMQLEPDLQVGALSQPAAGGHRRCLLRRMLRSLLVQTRAAPRVRWGACKFGCLLPVCAVYEPIHPASMAPGTPPARRRMQ